MNQTPGRLQQAAGGSAMGKLLNAVLILLIAIAVFHLNIGYYIVRGFHGNQNNENNELITVPLNESEIATTPVNETIILTPVEKGQDALSSIAYHLELIASQMPLNDVTNTIASIATAIVLIIVPLLILTHLIVSIAVR